MRARACAASASSIRTTRTAIAPVAGVPRRRWSSAAARSSARSPTTRRQKEFSVELLSVDKWIKDDGLQAVFIPDFADDRRAARPRSCAARTRAWCCSAATAGTIPARLGPAAGALDGAVFVDGFFPQQPAPRARRTSSPPTARAYGGTPEILEAQAYDAAMLVAAALQRGARSREQVVQTLRCDARTVEGAAGAIALGAAGHRTRAVPARASATARSARSPARRSAAADPLPPRRAGAVDAVRLTTPSAGAAAGRRATMPGALPRAARSRRAAPARRAAEAARRDVGEIGEFALLARLLPACPAAPASWLGPGDDCAVVAAGAARLLLTIDALVEGVHFRRALADAAAARPQGLPGQRQRRRRRWAARRAAAWSALARAARLAGAPTWRRSSAASPPPRATSGAALVGGNLTRAARS